MRMEEISCQMTGRDDVDFNCGGPTKYSNFDKNCGDVVNSQNLYKSITNSL